MMLLCKLKLAQTYQVFKYVAFLTTVRLDSILMVYIAEVDMDKRRELDDNAVRTECVESLCDDLLAMKELSPMLREAHLLTAAYLSALELGWGENDSELKIIFRRVAACLRWPTPSEIA